MDSTRWDHDNGSSSSSSPIPPRYQSSTSTSSKHKSRNVERIGVLEEALRVVRKQLKVEEIRTSEAHKELQLANACLQKMKNAWLAMCQDAAKAKEELRLYKEQLRAAQEEIYRAQDILQTVDRQKNNAEKEAAQARATVRKLNQNIMVRAAMDEGRKVGFRQGLERGRRIGIQESQMMAQFAREEGEGEGEEYDGEDNYSEIFDAEDDPRPRIASVEDIRTSPATEITQLPPDPIPIPPPDNIQTVPDNQHRGLYNPSPVPSVRYSRVSIPPDGYIPALDADHVIRIPPPFELSRPPPTPEQIASPLLPHVPETQPPIVARSAAPHRKHKPRHRNSSTGSTSTAFSQFDIVKEPEELPERSSPLSVIPEVRSAHASPHHQSIGTAYDLKHQSSWGGSSRHSNDAATTSAQAFSVEPGQLRETDIYRRPRISSSSSNSLHPVNLSQEAPRRSFSSGSTVPDINIQPPSRPSSFGTPRTNQNHGSHRVPVNVSNQSVTPPSTLPGDQLPRGFIPTSGFSPSGLSDPGLPIPPPKPMPGAYDTNSQMAGLHLNEGPVIPDVNLYTYGSEGDLTPTDGDSLSTPPPGRHKRVSSLDTLMTPPPSRDRAPSSIVGYGHGHGTN